MCSRICCAEIGFTIYLQNERFIAATFGNFESEFLQMIFVPSNIGCVEWQAANQEAKLKKENKELISKLHVLEERGQIICRT